MGLKTYPADRIPPVPSLGTKHQDTSIKLHRRSTPSQARVPKKLRTSATADTDIEQA